MYSYTHLQRCDFLEDIEAFGKKFTFGFWNSWKLLMFYLLHS